MAHHGNNTSAGPGSGFPSGPVPIRGREERVAEIGGGMHANDFDVLLSRSLPSSGPMLQPEALEHSMLQGRRRSSSNVGGKDNCPGPYPAAIRGSVGTCDTSIGEQTPLLGHVTFAGDGSDNTSSESPFLNGISRTRFWFVFACIMLGYFVACFDSTIMSSSHPVITSYFGSSNSASWLSTAFLLTSTSFQPILCGLSDAVGRKPPYVATLLVFFLGTVWCALAQSMTTFILARALCGLGAGGMMSLGGILVSDMVPIEIRGAYQSYINMTYGLASMLGAALGGLMADHLGWRWEFGIQLPIVLLCLVVAILGLPADMGRCETNGSGVLASLKMFDYWGSLLMSISVTFLILGLNLGGNILPWSHPFVLASLVIFLITFPLFLYVEGRTAKPIMPLRLILESPHANLIASNHLAAFSANAIIFNVPLFFQGVLLTSATVSGLCLVLPSLFGSIAGTATGFIITRTRRLKWPLVLGTVGFLVGSCCLSAMRRGWPLAVYLLCLLPHSAGMGFQFPGTFMAILAVSEQREQAVVTSALVLWRSLGTVLGIATSSLVVQNGLSHYLGRFVTGPHKEQVIEQVKQRVEAIRDLPAPYRDQVVQGYESALRLNFIMCVLVALACVLLILPVRLPRLGERKDEGSSHVQEAGSGYGRRPTR